MRVGRLSACVLVAACTTAVLAQDNPVAHYGTQNGDNFRRARVTMPVGNWTQGWELAWELDTVAAGAGRTFYNSSLTFDESGNTYWVSSNRKLCSATPTGTLRWAVTIQPAAAPGDNQTSPVVGANAVYAISGGAPYDYDGDGRPGMQAGAYNKATGAVIWQTDIDPVGFNTNAPGGISPVLANGKLYVITIGSSYGLAVTQLDAATGNLDWHSIVDSGVGLNTEGCATYVPGIFSGDDGLFFNINNSTGAPTEQDVWGIRIVRSGGSAGAYKVWSVPGGKRNRAHLIYSPVTNLLYAHTWQDYEFVPGTGGQSFAVYNPLTGAAVDTAKAVNSNAGFYDVGCLYWDDKSVVVGGNDGGVVIYTDNDGDGIIDVEKLAPLTSWYGEPRIYGQLFPADANGGPYLLTGTNSRSDLDPSYSARIVLVDLADAQIPNTDDGPAYFDNLRIYSGTDYNDAINNGLVFSEDFETGFPTVPGPVAQKTGWADVSRPLASGPPLVVADPTGGGNGNVLKLDPFGNQFLPAQGQGAEVALPVTAPVGSDTTVVVRFRQFRTDLKDNIYAGYPAMVDPLDGSLYSDRGVFEWDGDGRIRTSVGWAQNAAMTAGVWEDVELVYTFDPLLSTYTLTYNGTPAPGDAEAFDGAPLSSWTFIMHPTPPVNDTGITEVTPVAIYVTGVIGNHQRLQRGGPLMGPDGKVYYFRNDNGKLVALQWAAPALCPGDMDCNGQVDFDDIDLLVEALGYPGGSGWPHPCPWLNGDCNGDGNVNFDDIDAFVARIGATCD